VTTAATTIYVATRSFSRYLLSSARATEPHVWRREHSAPNSWTTPVEVVGRDVGAADHLAEQPLGGPDLRAVTDLDASELQASLLDPIVESGAKMIRVMDG
jgi:hypothetical protein